MKIFIHIVFTTVIIIYINKNSILNINQCLSINNFILKKTFYISIKLHPVYVYGDWGFDYINDLCIQISKTNLNNHSFYINKFNDKFNNPFPKKSPFSHPNIIINDFSLFDSNSIVTLTSSHKNYNNFNYLDKTDFKNIAKNQFISNSFHFLQKDWFKEQLTNNVYEITKKKKKEFNINNQIEFIKSQYIFDKK